MCHQNPLTGDIQRDSGEHGEWLGFKARHRRHIWVKFVVDSLPCSERFFFGYSGFLLTNNSQFQFYLERTSTYKRVLSVSWVNKLQLTFHFLQFTRAPSIDSQLLDERAPRAGEFWWPSHYPSHHMEDRHPPWWSSTKVVGVGGGGLTWGDSLFPLDWFEFWNFKWTSKWANSVTSYNTMYKSSHNLKH